MVEPAEPTDQGPQTREEWLENNKAIALVEGLTEYEVFVNQVETRLAFDADLRDASDERLGDAYVACLAHYEAQSDHHALKEPWAPLTVLQLVGHYGVSTEEAEVLVKMTAGEYSEPNYVVIDPDSGEATGPFYSIEEAKEYFINLATKDGWTDVLELVEKTGFPFHKKGDPFTFTNSRAEQLQLVALEEPTRGDV